MVALRFTRLKLLSVILAAFFSFSSSGPQAAERIGSAEKIVNQVTGKIGKAKAVRLAVGKSVHRGEQIRSQPGSSAEFVFKDQTRLAVGANAAVFLDEFVYAGAGGSNKIILNAVKGAFRFASGKAGSKSYSIRTPTSTVGVRGTMFDGYIGPDGSALVVLLSGQVEVCNHAGACVQLTDPCQCALVEPNGRIRGARRLTSKSCKAQAPARRCRFFWDKTSSNHKCKPPHAWPGIARADWARQPPILAATISPRARAAASEATAKERTVPASVAPTAEAMAEATAGGRQ